MTTNPAAPPTPLRAWKGTTQYQLLYRGGSLLLGTTPDPAPEGSTWRVLNLANAQAGTYDPVLVPIFGRTALTTFLEQLAAYLAWLLHLQATDFARTWVHYPEPGRGFPHVGLYLRPEMVQLAFVRDEYTASAGEVSHHEFLAGALHEDILTAFPGGETILQEALTHLRRFYI